MATVYITIDCPDCSEQVEVGIEVEHFGSPGNYFEPGEGAEWGVEEATESCEGCGYLFTPDYLSENHEDYIQKQIGEYELNFNSYEDDY